MGQNTSIEWADKVWNCLRGCTRISRGCGGPDGGGCYAEAIAARFSGPGQAYEGLARMSKAGPRWTGEIKLLPEKLEEPLHWKKPSRIFVNSMSDLFHEKVPNKFLDQVFAVMALCPQHCFQVLTKRPERMQQYVTGLSRGYDRLEAAARSLGWSLHFHGIPLVPWPIPSVWLGVSCEDQATADERIPWLLKTPAAVRFLSCEPLLGPVDLSQIFGLYEFDEGQWALKVGSRWDPSPDWVIAGAESGHHARPMDEAWVRTIRDQCQAASVKFFYKQKLDERGHKVGRPLLDGKVWDEFPEVRS